MEKKKAIFCNYRLLYRQKYDTPKTANRNTKKSTDLATEDSK